MSPDLAKMAYNDLNIVSEGVQGPPGSLSGLAHADVDMNGHSVTNAESVVFTGEFNNGGSGIAKTISLKNGNKQKIVIDQNTVLTIDPTGAGVSTYQIRIIQDGTGNRTVSFAGLSTGRWLGSPYAPNVNPAASGETILSVFFDGANMIQSLAKVGAA